MLIYLKEHAFISKKEVKFPTKNTLAVKNAIVA